MPIELNHRSTKRGHRVIENGLHRVKDLALGEDQRTIHRGQGPTVMALLRDAGLSLLRHAGIQQITARLRARSQDPPPAVALVERLDLERYKATVKGLTQFGDRRQGTDRNRAAVDWIEAQLKSYGCPTERIGARTLLIPADVAQVDLAFFVKAWSDHHSAGKPRTARRRIARRVRARGRSALHRCAR